MKQNLLSLIFSAFVLTAMLSLASCGGDDDGPAPDPCLNTTLAVTATSDVFDIEASATGGESPYQFSIDGTNFQSSGTFENLDPKTYTVTVQDANECIKTTTIVVEDACAGLAVTVAVEEYTVEATATGGTTPYEFSLDGTNFQASTTFADVVADNYTLTVKDANACTATVAVTAADLESFIDSRDNQRYQFVKIGTQVWMAENFNLALDTAYFCYDNTSANCDTYGGLYTWYAAMEAAPEGWHLPSDTEWETLIAALGGNSVAGGKLQVGGETGFEAKLAGGRLVDGTYVLIEESGVFWSSQPNAAKAETFVVEVDWDGIANGQEDKEIGLSIRYIKD